MNNGLSLLILSLSKCTQSKFLGSAYPHLLRVTGPPRLFVLPPIVGRVWFGCSNWLLRGRPLTLTHGLGLLLLLLRIESDCTHPEGEELLLCRHLLGQRLLLRVMSGGKHVAHHCHNFTISDIIIISSIKLFCKKLMSRYYCSLRNDYYYSILESPRISRFLLCYPFLFLRINCQ